MFSFLAGVVVGAAGFWLYSRSMAETRGGEAPVGRVQRPSSAEVHGRPREPLPVERPPAPEVEHPIGLGRKG
ncbi:MAG: hypothetical protein HY690_10995 [Chloroflexi bacterium]|nr:hypothetical protein [Chloroflexota bacterium]